MKFFGQTLVVNLAHRMIARLADSARGRRVLEQCVTQTQAHLGVGHDSRAASSGEGMVVGLLRKAAAARPAEGLCVFDVGANQGQFLGVLRGGMAGVDYRIHCFEPSPTTFALLQENAGGVPNVLFNPFGLGSAAGEFDLFSDETGSGLASLSHRRLEHFGIEFNRRESVQIRTLDAYCAEKGVGRIDLLKMDVEGHELEVLKGGARMFAEGRVERVTFEFGGCNIDSRTFFQDFYYFFREHGMPAIFRILPSGGLHRIEKYDETLEQFRTTNFLVLRDEREVG